MIGLVFSLAADERRREIAILKVIGATGFFIFRSILAEAAFLALVGNVIGITLASFGVFIFRDYISNSLRMPFLFPSPTSLATLFVIAVAVSLITVTAVAFIPVINTSRQEPALAMRAQL